MSSTPEKAGKESRRRRKKKADGAASEGRMSQFKTLYQGAKKQDPRIPLFLVLAFLVGFGAVMMLNFIWFHPFYFGFIGILVGLLVMMIVFGRLAERAAYGALDGQPGAAGAALGSIRRGWFIEQEPVAAEAGRARNVRDMASAAMIFRAVGRPGVVLVGEGPRGGVNKLLKSETKKVHRVVGPEVPVITYRIGKGDDCIPVGQLTKRMKKLEKKLTKEEVSAVTKRLRAISKRPPIPAGMDPRNQRPDRRAMRGR